MILVVHFIFLSEDDKPWKLLKSLRNPAASSHNMIFNYLIVHITWNLVHVWIIGRMISSIAYFKEWGFLSQLLSDVFAYFWIYVLSFTLLLVLIFLNIELILLLLNLTFFIIVYLSFHFWSFVNFLTFTLNSQEPITIIHILTFVNINSSSICLTCSSCRQLFNQSCTLIYLHFSSLLGSILSICFLILYRNCACR